MRQMIVNPATKTITALVAVSLIGSVGTWGLTRNITDENICDAVEDTIFFDKAVPFNRVDVTCTDGVVTLTGKTTNLLAKRRAARLAETVKGVRGVVNRVQVRPTADRSAAALKQNVEKALLADPATDSYQVNVMAIDKGHITLSGAVESWQEKQLTEKVAMGVRGVTDLTNNIEIDYETERTDAEIKPEVQQALEWNALVDHSLIDVHVNNGTVKLTGTVGSAAEKRQARYDAWVAGVEDVDVSGLKVREWARDEDRRKKEYVTKPADEIRAAIEDANLYDPRVNSFNVKVDMTGSVATLRGTVDNLKAKRAAARNARNTVGVARVINRLKVRPGDMQTDERTETQVRQALMRDPYVDRYDINVNVVAGTAYLAGTVDSYFEKAQAEDVAARINGVTDVSNAVVVTETNWPVVYDPYVYDWYIYDYGWYDYEPAYVDKTDVELKEDIKSEMWWSPFVDSDEVNVTVEDGVATLSGTVDTWAERRSAAENALEGGAVAVDNDLIVTVQ